MTMRYRQAYPKTDESLDVRDWNYNMQEIASEFNGYLDRDNVPQNVIDLSMIDFGTFNKIYVDAYDSTVNNVSLDSNSTAWQSDDGTDNIGQRTILAPCDALLICEFSCYVETSGTVADEFVRFRIVVDGQTVAVNGFSVMHSLSKQPFFIAGAIPVLAGTRVVKVQAQLGKIDSASTRNCLQLQTRAGSGITVTVKARELVVIERRR